MVFKRKCHFLAHRQRDDLRLVVGKDDTDGGCQVCDIVLCHGFAIREDHALHRTAVVVRDRPRHRHEERGLSCPVRPRHDDEVPLAHRKRHIFQCWLFGKRIGVGQMLYADDALFRLPKRQTGMVTVYGI